MFRLYGYVDNRMRQLDESIFEEDIIQTLGEYISRNTVIDYVIVLKLPEQDIPYKSICSLKEYADYIAEYEENNKEKSKILTKKKNI